MNKSDFFYNLPENLIAQFPLPERSTSRMLCLSKSTGVIEDKQFIDLLDSVGSNDILVFNNTKVIPARLFGNKLTGGKVELLIERIINDRQALVHMRASKSPKVGNVIKLEGDFQCTVLGRDDDLYIVEFVTATNVLDVLANIGHIPLPPYITRVDNASDLTRYQTVFAQEAGAVAAPTAGLHFDRDMLEQLAAKKIASTFVTLHVGSGTFRPVRVENLAEHVMHKEFYSVSVAAVTAINAARAKGGRVIAIGTTAVRALESASQRGGLQAGCGDTDLFIVPGYRFQSVDALLTNFHLPESTLLMLVSAFAGYEAVMRAYQHAIAKEYRFFSYGDAMFLSDAGDL